MTRSFDVIVIGVGSMGASTCYYLAKAGVRVLGMEQFSIPNEQASHTGQTRIIRKAYFEHPDYVPLLQRAYQQWHAIEQEANEQVYYPTGLLYSGPPDHDMIKGVRSASASFDIDLTYPDHHEVKEKYPDLVLPDSDMILFEPAAGFVRPDVAIRLYAAQAESYGATIHTREKVISWSRKGESFEVITQHGQYSASKLILTSGAWTAKLIPMVQYPLRVTKQSLAWVKQKSNSTLTLGSFPCWMFASHHQRGVWYGFPELPDSFGPPQGFKIALHAPGHEIDPDVLRQDIHTEDEQAVDACIRQYFPRAVEPEKIWKSCMYTSTPDEHFIIDTLEAYQHDVVIAAGFSGHGFKFASVMGEILADLALRRETTHAIDFLRLNRFSR